MDNEANKNDIEDFLNNFCKEEHQPPYNNEEFYFETDFLAIKCNPDYLKLMKTLAILEVQRNKVAQNIDKLEELKIKAYENPYGVKDEILKNKPSCLFRCNIEKIPEIDWSKYKTLNNKNQLLTSARNKLRPKISENDVHNNNNEIKQENNHIKVRGRVFSDEKPETFNQLWTVEEQLRLEALLEEFPPEPVENRRWKKIADALGNRTTQQVCSRVQKYFKKLHKAGVSVPGTSKKYRNYKIGSVHKRRRQTIHKPSTFFPGISVAELNNDSDNDSSSNDDEINDISHWNEILEMIKDEKNNVGSNSKVHHYGYKCTRCSECPIIGTRWECKSCPSISMCSDCMIALLDDQPPPIHPLTHHYKPKKMFINLNYSSTAFLTNNYLDPNFIR